MCNRISKFYPQHPRDLKPARDNKATGQGNGGLINWAHWPKLKLLAIRSGKPQSLTIVKCFNNLIPKDRFFYPVLLSLSIISLNMTTLDRLN
jgi:hypothetical protein